MKQYKLPNLTNESGSSMPENSCNAANKLVDEGKCLSSETKIKRMRKSKKRELTPELFEECVREGMIEFLKKLPQILGKDKNRQ
jgi:hypothetical protein